MRGETPGCRGRKPGGRGLSPHARGNPVRHIWPAGYRRSIPACAGKPVVTLSKALSLGVYPRMRGETERAPEDSDFRRGLSPHARGNQPLSLGACCRNGSIPACAGKPGCRLLCPQECRVYPRMRGETCLSQAAAGSHRGLSPHARGNPSGRSRANYSPGSIPACAGKPRALERRILSMWVYPRMRGETYEVPQAHMRSWGLSPHARGNPHVKFGAGVVVGSIPACAGKPEAP